jgi:kynurenine formamidase
MDVSADDFAALFAAVSNELEAAERAQRVTVGPGDILLIRNGHARRLAEFGPWETAGAKAGLHPTAMPFVAERRVAALGSDGNSDTAPSTTEGVPCAARSVHTVMTILPRVLPASSARMASGTSPSG